MWCNLFKREKLTRDLLDSTFLEVVTHPTGRKVLLHLLAPREPRYFDPQELEQVAPAMVPKKSEGEGEGDEASKIKMKKMKASEEPEMVSTSKKAPQTRRMELLRV